VGIVTLATLLTTLRDILVVDVLVGVVVVLIDVTVVVKNDGHKAPIIPPFSIIPRRELAVTVAPEQASETHAAFEVKAAWHAAEQPFLKSESVQTSIELSYSTKHRSGTEPSETP
jgi:hypothetical protein